MTMTSADCGLPFPLKKGQVRQGSASGDRSRVKGLDSQQKGVNNRESLSIEAVRDYGNEVTSFYLLILAYTSYLSHTVQAANDTICLNESLLELLNSRNLTPHQLRTYSYLFLTSLPIPPHSLLIPFPFPCLYDAEYGEVPACIFPSPGQ